MQPSVTNLTSVLLKFDKTTVLLPVNDKMTISDLKRDFIEALSSTKSKPKRADDDSNENGSSKPFADEFDEKSFKLYKKKVKSTDNIGSTSTNSGHNSSALNSNNDYSEQDWIGIEDDDQDSSKSSHKKLSHFISEEAEVLGVGFRSSDGAI
ncbi:expressed protein [Phakopsora pachyrhizi]|uniref:Expressed protein n=1 Tax=Phakopsora pachyrhizi TaxID=170000 RepID=A0AAV0AJI8_PHAPC|nr:expressed protein [Phakopsora pachyrhizi]